MHPPMRILGRPLAVFAILSLAACSHATIGGTNVADTRENREVVEVLGKYKMAAEAKDVDALMQLVSTDYFDVAIPGADRVDFWACDAMALPFAPGAAALTVALNLLDCVPDPRRLLESLAAATRPGGDILLATPYDWATRATPLESWLGGHSQRAPHDGAGEAFLAALLNGDPSHAIPGLSVAAELPSWPWHTRLHDRSAVLYRSHLLALRRS